MIDIDSSFGEGGGQILRTSLALSLITGRAVHLFKIRKGRKKPGLLAQHMTAVKAAAAVGRADVTGVELGSTEITFRPKAVVPGEYRFAVSTAGSAGLVLQTVLMPLALAMGASRIALEGGTHNASSPPFDFLKSAFLPLLERAGFEVGLALERHGFYPQGGGRYSASVGGKKPRSRLELLERGALLTIDVRALVSKLPAHIGERELSIVERTLAVEPGVRRTHVLEVIEDALGPGNAIVAEVKSEHATEVFTAFGEKGKPAERVAEALVAEILRYLDAGAPVGEHLQDQLLLPLALGGGGIYRTVSPSSHTTTNIETIRRFLECEITVRSEGSGTATIEIAPRPMVE